jgi:hypothetical protein
MAADELLAAADQAEHPPFGVVQVDQLQQQFRGLGRVVPQLAQVRFELRCPLAGGFLGRRGLSRRRGGFGRGRFRRCVEGGRFLRKEREGREQQHDQGPGETSHRRGFLC